MTLEELMALPIEHIKEEDATILGKPGSLNLRFNIYSHGFYLYVPKLENTFIPSSIMHKNRFKHCPFCQSIFAHKCSVLEKHTSALFERLIEVNHLRLLWVNRHYKI